MSEIKDRNQLTEFLKGLERKVSFSPASDPPFENTIITSELNDFSVKESFLCYHDGNPVNLCVVEYATSISRSTTRDYYWIGVIQLKKSFPGTYIRPEQLADKLAKLFIKIDVVVPGERKFNSKYFLASDQPDELLLKANSSFFNYLSEFDEMTLEINKNLCFFRIDNKPVSEEQTILYLQTGVELSRKLNS